MKVPLTKVKIHLIFRKWEQKFLKSGPIKSKKVLSVREKILIDGNVKVKSSTEKDLGKRWLSLILILIFGESEGLI